MAREQERIQRSKEAPIVGGLPQAPGIGAAMQLHPDLAAHLRGLADTLLVHPYAGTSLSRGERELLATAASATNDCFFCMDSHGAFACELLAREGKHDGVALVESVHDGTDQGLSPKLAALVRITRTVARRARDLTRDDVAAACAAGATDADTQLAVLIASAFSMYNRIVDGFRAQTPPVAGLFAERAREIADQGYALKQP
jgi:uncharacterized peroxidase-related enzyme